MRIFLLGLLISTSSFASSVLFIGDSQSVGPFGRTLHDLFLQEHEIKSYAACGSIGEWWFTGKKQTCGSRSRIQEQDEKRFSNTPNFPGLMKRIKPNYVIMQFGGNYKFKTKDGKFVVKSQDEINADVQKLIVEVKKYGSKCLFVSGPDTYSQRELLPIIVDRLKIAVGNQCEFFNSLEVTKYPDEFVGKRRDDGHLIADGKHYSFEEGEPMANAWADLVFQTFTEMEQAISLSSDLDRLHSGE